MKLPKFLQKDQHGLILLAGHRIGLHDVLHFYREGYSPEMILGEYPTLPLATIHKVIAFYLDHQDELDGYLERERRSLELRRRAAKRGPSLAELRERMRTMQKAEV